MAAPIANKIILPLDSGNTGKNVRTQTRVVGADTVHEHFFIPISGRSKLGIYHANPGPLTPPIAVQNGGTTGMFWLYNPLGSTIKMSMRRWQTMYNFAALAVDLVPGDFRLNLFTFTGVGAGTQVTPAKHDSVDASPVGQLRLASTGLVITVGALVRSESGPILPLATGSGVVCGSQATPPWDPDEDGQLVLRAGEGVVFWSALGLTTANRRIMANLSWEEFE